MLLLKTETWVIISEYNTTLKYNITQNKKFAKDKCFLTLNFSGQSINFSLSLLIIHNKHGIWFIFLVNKPITLYCIGLIAKR
jgi:hypothetical protein